MHPLPPYQSIVHEVVSPLVVLDEHFFRKRPPLALSEHALDVRHALAVLHPRNRTLEKLHQVAREGARLVTQDGVDHSELLVEVRRAGEERRVRFLVVHLAVEVQKDHRLRNLHHLDRDVERDWDEVPQQNESRDDVRDGHHPGVVWVKLRLGILGKEEPLILGFVLRLNAERRTFDDAENGEDGEHGQDDEVEDVLDGAALRGRVHAVHHHLGVVPGKNGDAEDPIGVAQAAPAQKDVHRVERHLGPIENQVAGEGVEAVVWHLALHRVAGEAAHRGKVKRLRLFHALPHLEVGFAIEIHGLHVTHALRVARRQKEQIRWEKSVLLRLDNVANHNIFPHLFDKRL
mmetsp:Transcript_31016/g.101117  ORF Transcript_31016/g.101117 Transcript_31016/m.101117 type:complete len:346 (-) Transcript_31016:482-1519(-)